jgi:hypothetical protein
MGDKVELEHYFSKHFSFLLPIIIPPILCHLSSVVRTDTHEATAPKDTVSPHSYNFYHHRMLME